MKYVESIKVTEKVIYSSSIQILLNILKIHWKNRRLLSYQTLYIMPVGSQNPSLFKNIHLQGLNCFKWLRNWRHQKYSYIYNWCQNKLDLWFIKTTVAFNQIHSSQNIPLIMKKRWGYLKNRIPQTYQSLLYLNPRLITFSFLMRNSKQI